MTLEEQLAAHRKWLNAEAGGTRAELQEAQLQGAELQGAELQDAELQSAELREAKLQGAELQGANLREAKLQGANLQGAELQGANLREANLQGAELQGANLREAELQGANLQGAELQDANLRGAKLQGADLRGADLWRADLWRADLQGAKLQGADLQNADFQGAELGDTCLSPDLLRFQREFVAECPAVAGYRMVYRAKTSQYGGNIIYEVGKLYEAPILSFSCETACHPGIYAASWRWMQANMSGVPLVKCRVADGDWVITAKGAIRCAKLEVLDDVEESHAAQTSTA